MSDTPKPAATPSSWDPAAPVAKSEIERGFFAELLIFAWQNKWWWITPSLLIFLGLGILVFAAGQEKFAPFFYALF